MAYLLKTANGDYEVTTKINGEEVDSLKEQLGSITEKEAYEKFASYIMPPKWKREAENEVEKVKEEPELRTAPPPNFDYVAGNSKPFYANLQTDTGKMAFIKVEDAKRIKIRGDFSDFDFYLHPTLNDDGQPIKDSWDLSEGRSGGRIGIGGTPEQAIDAALSRLFSTSKDKFTDLVEKAVGKYGESPSYEKPKTAKEKFLNNLPDTVTFHDVNATNGETTARLDKFTGRYTWSTDTEPNKMELPEAVYKRIYGPREVRVEGVGSVDAGIAENLKKLNAEGYKTIQSHSGYDKDHPDNPDFPRAKITGGRGTGYISFLKKNITPEKEKQIKAAAESAGLEFEESETFFTPSVVVRTSKLASGKPFYELLKEVNNEVGLEAGAPDWLDKLTQRDKLFEEKFKENGGYALDSDKKAERALDTFTDTLTKTVVSSPSHDYVSPKNYEGSQAKIQVGKLRKQYPYMDFTFNEMGTPNKRTYQILGKIDEQKKQFIESPQGIAIFADESNSGMKIHAHFNKENNQFEWQQPDKKGEQEWKFATPGEMYDIMKYNPLPVEEPLKQGPVVIEGGEVSGRNVKIKNITLSKLEKIHEGRSTRAQAADESKRNQNTFQPNDPRVVSWTHDPGSSDVSGVDTKNKVVYKSDNIVIRKVANKKESPKKEKSAGEVKEFKGDKAPRKVRLGAGIVREGKRQHIELG
jgi:hypothetical protein